MGELMDGPLNSTQEAKVKKWQVELREWWKKHEDKDVADVISRGKR
jgi:hypothetical protein